MRVVIHIERRHLWLVAAVCVLLVATAAQAYRHGYARVEVTVNGEPMSLEEGLGRMRCADAVRTESVASVTTAADTDRLGGKAAGDYR